MRIATFNVQRMRLRDRDGLRRLDGARDGDYTVAGEDENPALDLLDRELTAKVLLKLDADIVALQEVFDQATLDYFHDQFLVPAGGRSWPYRYCSTGNDGHGFNVAVMSRIPLDEALSHADITCGDLGLEPSAKHGPEERIFRRDCLMVRVGELRLFICHFKAPYPDAERSWFLRRREAEAVRKLVEMHTPGLSEPHWLVLGDLNDPDVDRSEGEAAIAPLVDPSFSTDLLDRLPAGEQWSFMDPSTRRYSRPDALLASPALAASFPAAVPFYVRGGLELAVSRHQENHFAAVGLHRPHASDHAALAVDLIKTDLKVTQ